MKVDKDTLLKHHFWILVGLSVPVALIAILLLTTSVSSSIAALRGELKKKLDTVKMQPKRPEEVERKRVEADYLVKKETDAWAKAFAEQEAFMRWPRRMEATYHFADGLFATEVHLIKPAADKGELPADKPGELMHGMLVFADDNKFDIVDKDGKNRFRFYATPRLNKKGGVIDDRGEKKDLLFADLSLQNPKETAVAVTYYKSRYFNDRLTGSEQREYQKTYLSQIPPILRIVDPVRMARDEDGKQQLVGVVQFRGGGWMFDAAEDRNYEEIPDDEKIKGKIIPPADTKFLRFVSTDWKTNNDISDEAWIAQEDLWIQKELYRLVRAANDSLSAFDEVPGSRDNKKKAVTYKNPYFTIRMQLTDANTLEMQIANELNRRQKIETMRVRMRFTDPKTVKNAEPEVFSVVTKTKDADPLEPKGDPKKGDSRKIIVKLKQGPRRDSIYGLEQVLTWETAAVKRIDQVSIGAVAEDVPLSQKGMAAELRPYVPKPKEEATASDTKGGGGPSGLPGGGSGGSSSAGPGMMMNMAPGGKGGLGGVQGGATALPHGLYAERYLEVTPQFRRVPVAMSLIVDQNHVDRVLTAFNNSKLRFLMTQVLLNHYTRSVKPDISAERTDRVDEGMPGGKMPMGSGGIFPPGGKMPMGSGGFFPPGGKMPMGGGGGFFPGGGMGMMPSDAQSGAAATDDLEANMELVIYGIVTLYERYPPRPSQAGAPATETAK